MKLDAHQIMQSCIAERLGLLRYGRIMRAFNTVDISKSEDFQRLFNGYYRVRRNAEWREIYYTLFESMKTEQPTFHDIINVLYEKTKNIEASFSSKMLATLNPNQPIWDQYVLQRLGFRLTGKNKGEMLKHAVALYSEIVHWYDQFQNTTCAQECFLVFNQTLPDYTWISNVKKIDFFLWSS
jgi:hypothetical protein